MARVLLLCGYLSVQIVLCLSIGYLGDYRGYTQYIDRMIDGETADFRAWTRDKVENSDECCSKCEALDKTYTVFIFDMDRHYCACYAPKEGLQVLTRVPDLQDLRFVPHPVSGICAEKGMPGGFSDAEVDDKVTKAAEVAVTALAGITGNTNPVSTCGKNINLVEVEKVEKQVVAGTNYKLTLRLATHTPGNCNDKVQKVCEGITVYEKLPHMCSGDDSNTPCTELTNQQNIKCKDAPPTLGCNSTEFACADGLQCISSFYRCDGGPPDCSDGSDEAHCREQEDLSLGQYFLEAVDWMKKKDTPWRYFLPEDTDIDQDGNLSDLEVQHKFNTYMGELFKLIDQDKDNSITEEEFRSLKLDIPQLTKGVDIALENFPLRPFFLAADANGDGVYDEKDFLMPERISSADFPSFENASISTNVSIGDDFRVLLGRSRWTEFHTITHFTQTSSYWDWQYYNASVANIGQNEGAVICKSLGFAGLERVVEVPKEKKKIFFLVAFSCDGTEERLEDCQEDLFVSWDQSDMPDNLTSYSGMGVECQGPNRFDTPRLVNGLNQGLIELLDWENSRVIWEEGGRFLFIADANGDGKLTLEELAMKGKELMTKILEFLDENQDGKISLEDINLYLTVGPLQNLVSELFEDVTAGKGEIDLYNLEIAGQNMNKYFYSEVNPLTEFDNNRDGKLNAADTFYRSQHRHYRSPSEESFLLPMLSEKLDKNQDGKIQREELRQFIDEMFSQLDMDKDGALTLEDVYSLLRENGLSCLQVGALRSFTRVLLDKIDSVMKNFFSYIFHQFDIDGNGQILTAELEQMHVPCEPSGGHRGGDYGYRGPSSGYGGDYGYMGPSSGYGGDYGYRGPSSGYGGDYGYRGPSSGYGGDYGYRGRSSGYGFSASYGMDLSTPSPTIAADPYARKTCFDMYQTYFGTKILDLIRSFPEFVFSERHGRRPGGYGGGRQEAKKENLLDNLAKHACEMLT